MRSDVDVGWVEPGVGEEDKDEKEGGGEANDEDNEEETVCLLDALDWMEEAVGFNSWK